MAQRKPLFMAFDLRHNPLGNGEGGGVGRYVGGYENPWVRPKGAIFGERLLFEHIKAKALDNPLIEGLDQVTLDMDLASAGIDHMGQMRELWVLRQFLQKAFV